MKETIKKCIQPHQNSTGFFKKNLEAMDELKRQTSCGENYSINTRLNLKARFFSEQKTNAKIITMFCAMFFKEQVRLFGQLIISKAPSPIFVLSYLSKKELIRTLIHVLKVFNCKVSFKCRCQRASQLLRNLKLISSNFQNGIFEIITITVTIIVLIQMFHLLLLLNKKIKIKTWNTMEPSYHSKVSSTQDQVVSFFCFMDHRAQHCIFMFG